MKKTFQLHLRVEYSTIESMRKQAQEEGISLAELCRNRLRDAQQLARIESLIENIPNKMNDKK